MLLVISPSLHCIWLPMCSTNFPWFFCIFPCTCCVVTAPSSCRSFVWLCKFIPTPSALTLCPWLSASLSFALIQWTQVCSYNIIYCLLHLSSGHSGHRTLHYAAICIPLHPEHPSGANGPVLGSPLSDSEGAILLLGIHLLHGSSPPVLSVWPLHGLCQSPGGV